MELAKPQLDVGTMVHDWEAAEAFWTDVVGLPYTKFEKIGGGVRQHRFDGRGSVIKVNHSRKPNASFYGDELEALRAIRPGEEITHDYGCDWADVPR